MHIYKNKKNCTKACLTKPCENFPCEYESGGHKLTDMLICWLICWVLCWLICWLIVDYYADMLTDILTDMLNDTLIDILTDVLTHVEVELEAVRPDGAGQEDEEYRLSAALLPLRLRIDQNMVTFLQDFFAAPKEDRGTEDRPSAEQGTLVTASDQQSEGGIFVISVWLFQITVQSLFGSLHCCLVSVWLVETAGKLLFASLCLAHVTFCLLLHCQAQA